MKIQGIAACMILGLGLAGCGGDSSTTPATSTLPTQTTESADDAIVGVTTIAFVDTDGPKVRAIVVQYDTTLNADAVGVDTYDVTSYANLPIVYDVASSNGGPTTGDAASEPYSAVPTFARQNGTPGAATKVYVRATPTIDANGVGDATGKYVVIELNTDYQLAQSVLEWRGAVAGGVRQKVPVGLGDDAYITPGTVVKSNYEAAYHYDISPFGDSHSATEMKVLDDTLYTLDDLNGYKLYTDNVTPAHSGTAPDGTATKYADATVLSKVVGSAFQATHCFSEYDGQYHDVSLKYSLFVPSDYDASKKYMVVLHIEDAGGLGDDPIISLTEAQAAVNYASDRVQQLAKAQGYAGLIVVIPQIPQAGQSVADNLTGNEYLPATWQLIDHITSTYSIDANRIYGSGQSMGGMQILDMAAQRDNYFAGIWAIGSQWGNNYDKSATYHGQSYATYPTDGAIITNPDWQNWYYAISDDNILATNMTGDGTATGYWNQAQTLFSTLGGATIPYASWDPTTTSAADESTLLQALVATPSSLGLYWDALDNGDHKSTWIYAHAISYSYDWLLSQTRQSEVARGKLPLSGAYADGLGTAGYNSVTY
jgi:predicted peptidase